MSPSRPTPRRYSTHNAKVDAQLAELVKPFGDVLDRRLLAELMATVYRLGEDQATTGDLKLLNAAIKELRYAFKIFRPYRHVRKVATFGSARLTRQHPAYAMAHAFGHEMARAGWLVITGAASGIMKAGHEGAGRKASFGLNIRLPFEQEANSVIAEDAKLINCKYFFTRKLLFIKESHATVLFPGGFGTLDEGFESLTLVQTGKSDPRPIVFVEAPGRPFWQPMLKFFEEQLIQDGMIAPEDRHIYEVAHSGEDAARRVIKFYTTYHSQRYVGEVLVLRLQRRLPEAAVAGLTKEFRDVLRGGAIEQCTALKEEADETDLTELPRLVLQFDRKSYGRLLQLVHRINELGAEIARSRPAAAR